MASIPRDLTPYTSPVAEVMFNKLALSLLGVGFLLFSILFVYQLTTSKQNRSLLRELFIAILISILWGFGGLFGMLSVGLYV
jgi:hypothetical protein